MIIFDLDGTLYRTHETCIPALQEICNRYNIVLHEDDAIKLLYTTVSSFLNTCAPNMPDSQKRNFERELKAREIQMVKDRGRLFKGVEKMLKSLKSNGIVLAICSVGSKEYIDAVLERCKIRSYFSYIFYREGNRTKSQSIKQLLSVSSQKPYDCVVVGDSVSDFSAAKENGIPFIGVSYGYGLSDIVSAETIADNIEQLSAFLHLNSIYRHIEKKLIKKNKPLVLAINGIDTSGKTFFSAGLTNYLKKRGFHVQLIHLDDFHQPKAIRCIDDSPAGYIKNAFNLYTLAELLSTLKAGNADLQLELLDLHTDTYINIKNYKSTPESIIIVEGVMLYRQPIDSLFDYRVFLDISFDEALQRARIRDVPLYGSHIIQKYTEKYIPAQKQYIKTCSPMQHSNLVIDNTDYNAPKIIKSI